MGLFKPNIKKMKKKSDIFGLIDALDNKDGYVRVQAAEALLEKIPALVQVLKEGNENVRRAGVMALGKIAVGIGGEAIAVANALPPLLQALMDPDDSVREYATVSLAQIAENGGAKAVVAVNGLSPIIQALTDSNWKVRRAAAAVLGEIACGGKMKLKKEVADKKRLDSQDGQARAVVEAGGIPALFQALRDTNDGVRAWAMMALGKIAKGGFMGAGGEPKAVVEAGGIPIFINAMLTDNDKDARRYATKALGNIGSSAMGSSAHFSERKAKAVVEAGGIQALLQALKDKEDDVRYEAVLSLGEISKDGLVEGSGEARALVEAGGRQVLTQEFLYVKKDDLSLYNSTHKRLRKTTEEVIKELNRVETLDNRMPVEVLTHIEEGLASGISNEQREQALEIQRSHAGQTWISPTGIEFVFIPAGAFEMGEYSYGYGTTHEVTISRPYFLGKYPVTQAQWKERMHSNPSNFEGMDLPVERVNCDYEGHERDLMLNREYSFLRDQLPEYNCLEFIRMLNTREGVNKYRLPTEAEWEYACRAGSKTRFFFGDDESLLYQYAWFNENSLHTTHPVGMLNPNKWGLYDIIGNVEEWCHDWKKRYPSQAVTDPRGPESGSKRICRGGSEFNGIVNCESGKRSKWKPDYKTSSLGFRLLREL